MAATDLMEKTEILSAVTEGIFPDGPFRAARVGGGWSSVATTANTSSTVRSASRSSASPA